jgi:hypothetical protein
MRGSSTHDARRYVQTGVSRKNFRIKELPTTDALSCPPLIVSATVPVPGPPGAA